MARLGKSPFDDASGLSADLNSSGPGKINEHLTGNLVVDGTITSSGGGEILPNNVYLQSLNAAGSADLSLLKADASDNTFLNAKTGKVIDFGINNVAIGNASATALTYPVFNLSDGADKNHEVASFASGTAYTLTATPAALVFGTSSAQIVLDKAGTYLLLARVNLEFVGATFAANRTVTLALHRTNNTPADITGSPTSFGTNIVTTVSGVLVASSLPPVVVTTTNTNDIITLFGSVSVVPTAGSLQATEANIIAVRLF